MNVQVEDEQITLRKQIPVIGWSSWTIVKTVVVLLFSNLGIGLIHILSDYSLFTTYTHNVGSTVTKIAVFQLINSFAVPLVATALLEAFFQDTTNIGLWYGPRATVLPMMQLTTLPLNDTRKKLQVVRRRFY